MPNLPRQEVVICNLQELADTVSGETNTQGCQCTAELTALGSAITGAIVDMRDALLDQSRIVAGCCFEICVDEYYGMYYGAGEGAGTDNLYESWTVLSAQTQQYGRNETITFTSITLLNTNVVIPLASPVTVNFTSPAVPFIALRDAMETAIDGYFSANNIPGYINIISAFQMTHFNAWSVAIRYNGNVTDNNYRFIGLTQGVNYNTP